MCQAKVVPQFLYLPELFRLCNSTSTKWLPRLGPKLVPFILFMVLNFPQPSICILYYFILWNEIKYIQNVIQHEIIIVANWLINSHSWEGTEWMVEFWILNFEARAVSKSPFSQPASCTLSLLLISFVINYKYNTYICDLFGWILFCIVLSKFADVVVSDRDGMYSLQNHQSQKAATSIQNETILPQEWAYWGLQKHVELVSYYSSFYTYIQNNINNNK